MPDIEPGETISLENIHAMLLSNKTQLQGAINLSGDGIEYNIQINPETSQSVELQGLSMEMDNVGSCTIRYEIDG